MAPIAAFDLMECLSGLYNNPSADPVGHVFAFTGAKGGVGSSTICHNVAWTLSEALASNVVIADLDLAFGTTGLDFNQDPVQGIADALQTPERSTRFSSIGAHRARSICRSSRLPSCLIATLTSRPKAARRSSISCARTCPT